MLDRLLILVMHLVPGSVVDFVRYVEPAVWLYLAAAVIAGFWHTRMWLVYVAFAVLALVAPHI